MDKGIDENMLLNKKERDYLIKLLNIMLKESKIEKSDYNVIESKLNYFTR